MQTTSSISKLWAQKYLQGLSDDNLKSDTPTDARETTATYLKNALRSASAQSWNKTEALLASEVKRQAIDVDLLDPWQIAADIHAIYKQAIAAYETGLEPNQLSVKISRGLGEIRRKYTAVDPRILGFVSMQFHYTGEALLDPVAETASSVSPYFKVLDDHLYMPLQRAYEAASHSSFGSTPLNAVNHILPQSSQTAREIVQRVLQLYGNYRCYSGPLRSDKIQVSSLRDIEMFQVYLCVCILENNISAIQQELFPLCIMLYPKLNVKWELVRQLVSLLIKKLSATLPPAEYKLCETYLDVLWDIFSPDVFGSTDQQLCA